MSTATLGPPLPIASVPLQQQWSSLYRPFVYAIGPTDFLHVKIGFSRTPWVRLRDLQYGHPDELFVFSLMPGTRRDEYKLHRLFAEHRVRPDGEWFRTAPPVREWCLKWWLR